MSDVIDGLSIPDSQHDAPADEAGEAEGAEAAPVLTALGSPDAAVCADGVCHL